MCCALSWNLGILISIKTSKHWNASIFFGIFGKICPRDWVFTSELKIYIHNSHFLGKSPLKFDENNKLKHARKYIQNTLSCHCLSASSVKFQFGLCLLIQPLFSRIINHFLSTHPGGSFVYFVRRPLFTCLCIDWSCNGKTSARIKITLWYTKRSREQFAVLLWGLKWRRKKGKIIAVL